LRQVAHGKLDIFIGAGRWTAWPLLALILLIAALYSYRPAAKSITGYPLGITKQLQFEPGRFGSFMGDRFNIG
jgi:hypothetical protein